MRLKSLFFATTSAASLLVASVAFAQQPPASCCCAPTATSVKAGQLVRVTEKEAAWAARERASYPLEVCVTSDEKLGSMGKAAEYIYRTEGQVDRLVLFCCAGCEEDFAKEPAKYLAKIDSAAKAKARSGHQARH